MTLAALVRYVTHRAGFKCSWLTPTSNADKKLLSAGKIAHHSNIR
jgi:hypothetical protein